MSPWQLFYSYSHKDSDLRERLATYLAPLKQQNKIEEWYDRRIEPGQNWEKEITDRLDSANLFILLVTGDFLASDYCFGVEVERALARLKKGEVKIVPILAKPCLWQESRFSELQMVPRDTKPMTSWTSLDEAFVNVATEIRQIVSQPQPSTSQLIHRPVEAQTSESSLKLVRGQIQCYARLYERTRQRMPPSNERTSRMEQIFLQMRSLATASYPFLAELADSPSPGERLVAVSILHIFATDKFLPFLVGLVASEKPFVGYQAVAALRFAVGALDPRFDAQLTHALTEAKASLDGGGVRITADRQKLLEQAQLELRARMDALSAPQQTFD